MNNELRFRTMETGLSRSEMHDGKEFLVTPVVAVKSGVLNGEFLSAAEIEASVQFWNDVPVPIYHPDVNGMQVSARDLQIIEESVVGRFYNAFYEDESLKGELWIDIAKATALGGSALDALTKLQAGEVLEVSTAYFAYVTEIKGTHNGTDYTGEQSNIRPDHLALLPGAIGACSIADGCGANRTNEAGETMACKLCVQLKDGESMNDRRDAVEKAIATTVALGTNQYVWVADLYEASVVYELNEMYYRADYTINAEGEVVIGDQAAVKRTVSYVEVKANEGKAIKVLKGIVGKIKGHLLGVDKMATREEMVTALRANGVDLADDVLEKTEDSVLECMVGLSAPAEGIVEPIVPVVEPAVEASDTVTINEYLQDKGTDLEKVVAHMKAQEESDKTERQGLIDGLAANEQCTLSLEALEAMDAEVLRELSSAFQPGTYLGVGIPRENRTVPEPPTVIGNQNDRTKAGE